jgi:hypothetical protein
MMDRTDPYAMFLLLAVWVLLILVVDPLLRHSLTNPGALLDPLGLSAQTSSKASEGRQYEHPCPHFPMYFLHRDVQNEA